MASSQVDIAASAPFGCVLRDHNRRDRCRESNAHSSFQKNLKNLVRTISSGCSASDKKRERDQNNNVDSWVANGETNNHRSTRQSRILNRWAAEQAREVVSTIEKQSHEAEVLEISNSPSLVSSRASSSRREDSTTPSDSSTETSILGASSLVQIWEKRLNRLNGLKLNSATSLSPSRSTSGFSCIENGSSVEEQSSAEEARDSAPPNDDPFIDWESDRTALSDAPSSSQGQKSDAGENEKVRVADIIKRLASAYQTPTSTPTTITYLSEDNDNGQSSVHASPLHDQIEQRVFSQVISSPRIRGRQAFTDLLMHLERDRHRELETLVERRPVSRFTQRGRIQSSIRLRLLQRGMAIRDQPRPPSTTTSGVNRLSHGSTIMHLRDRFRTGAEQVATAQNSAAYPRSHHQEIVNNTVDLDNSSTTNQPSERTINQEVSVTEHHSTQQVQNSMPHTREGVREEANSSSDVTSQGTRLENRNLDSQATADRTTASLNFWDENDIVEELEVTDHEYAESSYDWIGDISQPRSYWKGHRQAQYKEVLNNSVDLDNSSTTNRPSEHTINQEVSVTEQHSTLQVQNSMPHTREDVREEASSSSDVKSQGTRLENRNLDSQAITDVTSQGTGLENRNLYSQATAESTTASLNFWDENDIAEELEVTDHEYAESSYDWIGDISRPRSYWEGRRQARYEEVLNNSSNGEIRKLLERGTVSNFLVSDFRERMDRLMSSRLERPLHSEEEEERGSQERIDQLMSILQRQRHLSSNHEEEEDGEGEEGRDVAEEEQEQEEDRDRADEEEEEQSLVGGQSNEASAYFDQSSSLPQMPSPSQLSSWTDRDNEVSDDYEIVNSTSQSPHLLPQPYHQDSQQNPSSRNPNSTEMELIYDLRGHMEQLYHEMSELRKSIKSCMDMQMMLQQSITQEVHSVGGDGKKSDDGAPKKGNCCICYEMQVDSLLYRCGHMCTCLKCAHELQWSNGKCPICRAPIVDVVRAYVGL